MIAADMSREIYLPGNDQFGFCEGVEAAHQLLQRVTDVAHEFGIDTVYGYHDIVHNKTVTNYHQERGVVFVGSLEEIPEGAVSVLSAHGSSPMVPWVIKKMGGVSFDGACALVKHTHVGVQQARERDEKVLYLLEGKPGVVPKVHDEVAGTVGHMDMRLDEKTNKLYRGTRVTLRRSYIELGDDLSDLSDILDPLARYRIVGQTTLLGSKCVEFREALAAAIIEQQPGATVGRINAKDVCRAVQVRQEGVRVMLRPTADHVVPDTAIIVTDVKSKNGKSYYELAKHLVEENSLDTRVIAIETAADLAEHEAEIKGRIGITAAASTHDSDTRAIVEALGGDGSKVPYERKRFPMPDTTHEDIRRRLGEWKA